MKRWLAGLSLASALCAGPALAGTLFFIGNNPFPGEETILLDGGALDATVLGEGNLSGGDLVLTAGEPIVALTLPDRIAASDGGLTSLNVATADANTFMTGFIADLTTSGLSTATITATLANSGFAQFQFTIGSGVNFFTVLGEGGTMFTNITIAVTGSELSSVNSLGAGFYFLEPPVTAIPEPNTWAMMIIGFGAIGCLLRARPRAVRRARA
jgi:hypothetical protein